jgi:hypothetical protein
VCGASRAGFSRGDAVVIRDASGVVGRGLVAYDAEEAARIIGRASREIELSSAIPDAPRWCIGTISPSPEAKPRPTFWRRAAPHRSGLRS